MTESHPRFTMGEQNDGALRSLEPIEEDQSWISDITPTNLQIANESSKKSRDDKLKKREETNKGKTSASSTKMSKSLAQMWEKSKSLARKWHKSKSSVSKKATKVSTVTPQLNDSKELDKVPSLNPKANVSGETASLSLSPYASNVEGNSVTNWLPDSAVWCEEETNCLEENTTVAATGAIPHNDQTMIADGQTTGKQQLQWLFGNGAIPVSVRGASIHTLNPQSGTSISARLGGFSVSREGDTEWETVTVAVFLAQGGGMCMAVEFSLKKRPWELPTFRLSIISNVVYLTVGVTDYAALKKAKPPPFTALLFKIARKITEVDGQQRAVAKMYARLQLQPIKDLDEILDNHRNGIDDLDNYFTDNGIVILCNSMMRSEAKLRVMKNQLSNMAKGDPKYQKLQEKVETRAAKAEDSRKSLIEKFELRKKTKAEKYSTSPEHERLLEVLTRPTRRLHDSTIGVFDTLDVSPPSWNTIGLGHHQQRLSLTGSTAAGATIAPLLLVLFVFLLRRLWRSKNI